MLTSFQRYYSRNGKDKQQASKSLISWAKNVDSQEIALQFDTIVFYVFDLWKSSIVVKPMWEDFETKWRVLHPDHALSNVFTLADPRMLEPLSRILRPNILDEERSLQIELYALWLKEFGVSYTNLANSWIKNDGWISQAEI
jgi:hypothetical protein